MPCHLYKCRRHSGQLRGSRHPPSPPRCSRRAVVLQFLQSRPPTPSALPYFPMASSCSTCTVTWTLSRSAAIQMGEPPLFLNTGWLPELTCRLMYHRCPESAHSSWLRNISCACWLGRRQNHWNQQTHVKTWSRIIEKMTILHQWCRKIASGLIHLELACPRWWLLSKSRNGC